MCYDEKLMKRQFTIQKWSATNRRGIDWQLSFDEWRDIWLESGKWHQRGIRAGQYQMCRHKDNGPYSKDNVRIDTMEANLSERKGRYEEGRFKRWAKPGAKEQHSILMRECVQRESYKQNMQKYLKSDQYIIDRARNSIAVTEKNGKAAIGTNIITGETIVVKGKKQIESYGFNSGGVSNCCLGKSKTHKGYTFRYI